MTKFLTGMAVALMLSAASGRTSAEPVYTPVYRQFNPTNVSLLDASRFHYSLALANRWQSDSSLSLRHSVPELGIRPTLIYQWSNHLYLDATAWRQVTHKSREYTAEVGLGFVW